MSGLLLMSKLMVSRIIPLDEFIEYM